jgi:hypothetical protein
MHTHLYEHTYANPYPYEHFWRTVPANLEIYKVTTGALLLTGTSPTTKSIAPINPRINREKYEHPCQVEDLNLGGQISPQGTQPADLDDTRLQ